MYRPAAFARHDREEALAFVDAHPFATLVSVGAPMAASHLPLVLDRARGERLALLGHLARANPQAGALDGAEVLAIFMGPHGYVSPRWYRRGPAVPTWNYAVAELRGRARLLDARATRAQISAMADRFEPQHAAWSMAALPAGYAQRMLEAIVGLEIEVTSIEAKFKMSQNQPHDNRDAVITTLEQSDRAGDRELAAFMRLETTPRGAA